MKKSLIALAAVAATGAAFAQSSVTMFGIVDTAVTYVDGKDNWSGMTSSGNASSRLGFRGVEDLGNGLKASFWLEGAISTDDGTGAGGGAKGPGFEFKRRSTIGLQGGFGEVRLGRELTAAYNAVSRYDVFGTVGIGQSRLWGNSVDLFELNNVEYKASDIGNRQSNMLTYLSPDFSGFKFGVNYAFGEESGLTDGIVNSKNSSTSAGQYFGGSATYDNGPLSVGFGVERKNRGASSTEVNLGTATAWNLGASYNFGVAKLAAAYRHSEIKFTGLANDAVDGEKVKLNGYMLAVSAPVGAAGEVKASYNHYEAKLGEKLKANQFALGYVHNLSKRTAVYGTYAYIKNKNNDGDNLGMKLGAGDLDNGGKQQAFQVGVRHSF